ncbi:glycosyltransferase family 4 protein [Cellulomonas citrea]|uniref:glycosyltransferase family 4 protein n=1 Tax=Cellulomonas citrea TaxID=1909423 RepID=UPI001359C395|nr:glycosyltransferase family 1 protein [Cellulomonas citrea]
MTATRRVAVDLLYVTGHRGGTETYARELLPRLADRLDDIEFVGLAAAPGAGLVETWFPGPVHRTSVDTRQRAAWALAETFAVEGAAARHGADLLWCPANYGPGGRRVPTLVTAHDVIPFEHVPPGLGRAGQRVTTWLLRRAARGATRLLAVSEDGARRAADVMGVDRERISVAPNGASTVPVPGDPRAVLDEMGVPRSRAIVVSAGNRMPHKNFSTLLRAVAAVPPERRPFLVLPGGGSDDPLDPVVAALGLRDDVMLPGWVTGDQLGALLAVADLYVCPSLDEGFGLPVVDAMRAGCPVLASDIAVLHEVGADAVEYVDARDEHALAAAVDRVLADPALRAGLRARGLERARLFTWDRSADLVAEVVSRTLAEVQRT